MLVNIISCITLATVLFGLEGCKNNSTSNKDNKKEETEHKTKVEKIFITVPELEKIGG